MRIVLAHRAWCLAFALCASACLPNCGARTPLAEPADRADAAQTDASTADVVAEDRGVADSHIETSPDAALPDAFVPEGAVPDSSVVACVLKNVGEPLEVYVLPGKDLHTPSMVVLNPGDATKSEAARVALQTVSVGIRLLAMTVFPPSASGTVVNTHEPIFVGSGSTYGHMAHAPGDLQQLALVWGADAPVFRTVDIPTWTLGSLVQVAQTGWTPNGLAAGKAVPNTQTGQFDGLGYGMTWQNGTGQGASVAVLSATGDIQVGPLWTSAGAPGQQLESSIAWSGSTYLMATRFRQCAAGDPLCREQSVVVSRLRVAPGSNSIEFASSFEAAAGNGPGYPTLDGLFMVWDEGKGLAKETRVVHVAQLAPNGNPAGPDQVVSSDARPLARPFIGSTPAGKLVGWAEDGDTTLADETLGRSRLLIQVLSPELGVQGSPLALDLTRYGSMGDRVTVSLDYPKGVLVAWSAQSRIATHRSIFVQFLPCGP